MRQATTLSVSAPPTLIGGEIPLIDVSGYPRRHAGRRRARRRRAALRLRECRLLLSRRPRRAAVADRHAPMPRRRASTPSRWSRSSRSRSTSTISATCRSPEKPPPNAAAQGKKPSQNEAYFLRRERGADDPDVLANRRFHAMNKWPARATCRASASNMLDYMGTLEALCSKLVRLYALALDLPETFFDACFADAAHDPAHVALSGDRRRRRHDRQPGAAHRFRIHDPAAAQQGAGPVDPAARTARWMDAPGVEDAFVVNGGDILHRWTNERFLSTPHRVRNVSGQLRYAMPFFCDPNHDTMIECLPTLPVGRAAGQVSADQVRRLCAVVRRPALRAHGQGADAGRSRDRAGRARHGTLGCEDELTSRSTVAHIPLGQYTQPTATRP